MKEQYIKDEYDEVIGVKGEETFKDETFNINGMSLRTLLTKAPKDIHGEEYYNLYILTYEFKQEPLNNLDLQEPYKYIESLNEKELLRFMEERAISFYLWFKYNRTYDIQSEEIPQ